MRTYWGLLTGLAIGAFGGVHGALFGLGIGLLYDLVAAERRAAAAAIRFLDGEPARHWLPVILVLAGTLAAHLYAGRRAGDGNADDHAPGRALPPAAVAWLVRRLHPAGTASVAPRRAEQIIAAAAEHQWMGTSRFAALARGTLPEPQREELFRAVWEVLRAGGAARAAREEARDLARRSGLTEAFLMRELVVRTLLDPEACTVLGIARDAGPHEIRTAYRRLAAQFHPDTAAALSESQRQASEQAFKRVRAAYEKVLATER